MFNSTAAIIALRSTSYAAREDEGVVTVGVDVLEGAIGMNLTQLVITDGSAVCKLMMIY